MSSVKSNSVVLKFTTLSCAGTFRERSDGSVDDATLRIQHGVMQYFAYGGWSGHFMHYASSHEYHYSLFLVCLDFADLCGYNLLMPKLSITCTGKAKTGSTSLTKSSLKEKIKKSFGGIL